MATSQETFFKKQREKERARKKKYKEEKKAQKKEQGNTGLEIDWSRAPENKTLTNEESAKKEANKTSKL